jgi:alpha-L-fucosidase
MRMLQQGDPNGSVWRPGETDVSIRPGWFHHPAEDTRVKSADRLVELYFTSVGRNSKLLLNVPPTREGLLHETDVANLAGMRAKLTSTFATDLAKGRSAVSKGSVTEIDLGHSQQLAIADLREAIEHGQHVARYTLEGADESEFTVLSRGTTIGYRKIDRFTPVTVRRVRLTIDEAVAKPNPIRIGLYGGS